MILMQGISTSDSPDLMAGRGVGMSIIQEKLSAINGNMSFNFEPGKYCEFIINLPLNS
jgi:two-component system chemotaxis sensor kinase CheA